MKYLIMKCEELDDQNECDVYREPITMTDNWKEWFKTVKPNYLFEVYEYKNKEFKCIKEYYSAMEEGMVVVWFDEDTPEGEFNVLERLVGYSRYDPMPYGIREWAEKCDDFDDSLKNCGFVSWTEDDKYYAYTEYADNRIYPPY